MRTSTIKQDIPIQRLKNGIFVKSYAKGFIEFTNCNLSQRLVEFTLLFSMMLKSTSFPLTVPNRTSNLEKDFSLQSLEFYSCIQFEIGKKIGLLILLNCEAGSLTVFATMCPKEQQTSDNLIVKDYCFITDIFYKGPVN